MPADIFRRTLVPAIMEQQSEQLVWRLRLRSYETVLEIALQEVHLQCRLWVGPCVSDD